MLRGGALVLALVALLAAACSIPADAEPEAIDVPSDVFLTGALPPSGNSSGTTTDHPVYFLRGEELVRVDRALPAPVLLDVPLNNLVAGPTTSEAEAGLESAIPAGSEVVNVQIQRNNVVSIHLNDVFFDVEGTQRVRATAQMVFTGSALVRNTQGVQFFLDGVPQSLPDGSGAIAELLAGEVPPPLHVGDFDDLLAAESVADAPDFS